MEFYDYLTDFIFTEDKPEKADIIFIPGCAYGELAENATRLYHAGYASRILVSGKYSVLTGKFEGALSPAPYIGKTYETECAFLTDVLLQNQVPLDAIVLEDTSTYTYENAIHARAMTDRLNLSISTALISCQAYHAKRCLLYYQLLYPDTRLLICPAVTRNLSRKNWQEDPKKIDLVLGEVERCGNQFHDILKNRLGRGIL